jgi:peptide/nickel transport system substrate-binding protein
MPARLAATDPFQQINEHVGSGPMRFIKNEWVPGARAIFEKFPDYVPRQEPASWLAGGKRIITDRVEWVVIADPATAAAALQNGEVDWWEQALPDLAQVLRKNRNVIVDVQDRLGNLGILRMNHLFPPFNDVRARRAILMAMSQEDYMRAYLGDDDKMWKPMPGFFTPGTRLYNEEGSELLKGPRKLDAAKRLLADSGYAGQPVTCMAAQDQPPHKVWGDVTADLLKRLGMNVDYAAVDWGTVVARRAQKTAPGQGGWQMFITGTGGADNIDPLSSWIRANGEKATFGWPNIPQVEAEIAAWYDATTLDDEKTIARRLNKAAPRPRGLRAAWLVPATYSLAQERNRHRAGPTAVLLGRQQNRINLSPHADLHRPPHRRDHPGDGGGGAVRVQPALHRTRRSCRRDRGRPGDPGGR